MRAVNFEGGDRVGKHTAVLATCELLLRNGYNVVLADLPNYWYFGNAVGKALRDKDFFSNLPPKREVQARCAMYALDRLLSLLLVEKHINKDPNTIFLSDRGWASNVLTLAYGMDQKMITEEDLPFLIKEFNTIDQVYINLLRPQSILVTTGDTGANAIQKGILEADDLFEKPGPQTYAKHIYKNHFQFPEIHTQRDGQWKHPHDIAQETLQLLGIATQHSENPKTAPQLTIIGPRSYFEYLYGDSYQVKNLFGSWIDPWESAFFKGDKTALKDIDQNIAQIAFANIPKHIPENISPVIKTGLQDLLTDYPELNNVCERICGQAFLGFVHDMIAS